MLAKGIREIRSSTNSLVKVFRRALAEGTTRQGWVAIEGPLLLGEALDAVPNAQVHSVLVGRSAMGKFLPLLDRLPAQAELSQVPDRLFQQIAQTEAPQGIAALVELPAWQLGQILARRDKLLLVACHIQDPGNLGAMVRSSQAFGATAVLTLKETASPFNPKAVRASTGAIFRLPVLSDLKPGAVVKRLEAARVHIVAADPHSPSPITQADLTGPLAILVGNEASGLPDELARQAHQLLSIPMRSGMDSLNAATAAGIFLYEVARQRVFRYV
jgi:TrmH family RNA methyltransferase